MFGKTTSKVQYKTTCDFQWLMRRQGNWGIWHFSLIVAGNATFPNLTWERSHKEDCRVGDCCGEEQVCVPGDTTIGNFRSITPKSNLPSQHARCEAFMIEESSMTRQLVKPELAPLITEIWFFYPYIDQIQELFIYLRKVLATNR